jgi:formylglycine-generating enzyme required for sulfatase activity
MMEAPRRALSGLVLSIAIVFPALAQDAAKDAAKAINAEIKKVEERIKEESDRVAKKKENLQVEFAAMLRDDTQKSLQAKVAEIGAKHRAALSPAGGAESRPPVPDALRNTIQEECRAALAATIGRNLAIVMEGELSSNLIAALSTNQPVDYAALVNDTINLVFTGNDFEQNYRRLAVSTFEKRLIELQGELAAQKQRLADLDADAKGRAMGIPAGMVAVPAGKYRIGSDGKEFDEIRKRLRYDPQQGQLDKCVLGWPPHDVELDEFFIDVNEVTNKYWAEFVKDTGRKPPKHWSPAEKKAGSSIAPPNGQPAGDEMIPAGMENLPITFVTYDEVVLFCEWWGRRLPTEFEWEAAARYKPAGDKSLRWWPWGDTYDLTKPFCNNQTAATHPLRQGKHNLTPVGSFPLGKSALGLNDLAGNAYELTSSYFTAYPGWKSEKAPSPRECKDDFSGSLVVLRGGTALGNELYSLTTTRKGMTKQTADLVGFRTALSKARGKDFIQAVAGSNQLAAQLEAVGPAMKDEKSGRPELALDDPTRYSALMAGGWDAERQLPARARFIGMACRNTTEFTDAAGLKSMARDRKKPVMLGYFRSEVDFVKPDLPKGTYWITWDPGRVKGTGKDKIQSPEGIVFRPFANPEGAYDVPGTPVLVAKSTEPTKLVADRSGSALTLIMSFPVRDRKESRFIIEMKLDAGPDGLKGYK